MNTYQYSKQTQDIMSALIVGKVCDDCGAPWHLRHFDDCQFHPENRKGRCETCSNGKFHNHIHHWHCGHCSMVLPYNVDHYAAALQSMDKHLQDEHPAVWQQTCLVRAMSADS